MNLFTIIAIIIYLSGIVVVIWNMLDGTYKKQGFNDFVCDCMCFLLITLICFILSLLV